MAIKRNISAHEISYTSQKSKNDMEKIVTKQKNNYMNEKDEGVENVSFDTEYKISSGDTLSSIAAKYGLTYQELAEYNNISDPNYIEVGKTINIPSNNEQPTDNNKEIDDNVKKLVAALIKNGAQSINEQIDNLVEKLNAIKKEQAQEKLQQTIKEINDTLKQAGYESLGIITKIQEKYLEEQKNKQELDESIKNLFASISKSSSKSLNEQVEKLVSTAQANNPQQSQEQLINKITVMVKDAFYKAGYVDPSTLKNLISLIVDKCHEINKTITEKSNKESYQEYTVESGNTLSSIAAKYGISVDDLIKANNITDPNNINVGQILKIPQKTPLPKKERKVTRDIDLSKILKDSTIGKAVEKYQDEIKDAFKVKIDEKEMITIQEIDVNGEPCFLTHIVISDPSIIKGEPANGEYASGVEKTSSAAKRKNATLMINGSNFLYGSGAQDLRNTNRLAIVNGQIVHDGSSLGMEICLDKNGRLFTPSPGTTASDLINQGVVYTFASLDSRLINNGEKDYISQPDNDEPYNSTVIGMTQPGEYYILTGETTNAGAREFLYDKGCTYAKSMDQGGSVSLVFKGELVNEPSEIKEREVGDFLYFE